MSNWGSSCKSSASVWIWSLLLILSPQLISPQCHHLFGTQEVSWSTITHSTQMNTQKNCTMKSSDSSQEPKSSMSTLRPELALVIRSENMLVHLATKTIIQKQRLVLLTLTNASVSTSPHPLNLKRKWRQTTSCLCSFRFFMIQYLERGKSGYSIRE